MGSSFSTPQPPPPPPPPPNPAPPQPSPEMGSSFSTPQSPPPPPPPPNPARPPSPESRKTWSRVSRVCLKYTEPETESSSSTPAPPPSSPEFRKAWRELSWDGRDQMVTDLRGFKLSKSDVGHLRILLHGPVGAGKSSFITSVNNIFQGRITNIAVKSNVKQYNRNGDAGNLPFVFNDVMGLEENNLYGALTDDIINRFLGRVRDDYKFNPLTPLSDGDPGYNSTPSLSDKAHCLVSVVSADSISRMNQGSINTMRVISQKASDLDIPQVVVMTMVDKACPLVKEDLRKVYTSKKIKEKMEVCSHKLGVPMYCILPVMNYHEQTDLDNNQDLLLLKALTQIVNFANDYVDLQ